MKWILVIVTIISIIIGYSYITVSSGPIEPLGLLGFVKFANPDMYPSHPHSELLAKYAKKEVQNAYLLYILQGVLTTEAIKKMKATRELTTTMEMHI